MRELAATIHVSAPGKVMVSGEYVVLDGAPAVVAAAPARARVSLTSASQAAPSDAFATPPEAEQARRVAEEHFGALPGYSLRIDTGALRDGGRKFGLGSSAAAAAGTVAAVATIHGVDISDAKQRADLLPLALEGHRVVAPEGSGADVAASMLGGFVRFQRHGNDVMASRLDWPATLKTALVWTGSPARTSDLVSVVKRFAAKNPSGYEKAIKPLREAADELLAAIERGDVSGAIAAADAHGSAMKELGEVTGAPIVTAELTQTAELARSVGGAAKPSGAGGGDVAIAFLPSEKAYEQLIQACSDARLTILPFALGDDGPRTEPSASRA